MDKELSKEELKAYKAAKAKLTDARKLTFGGWLRKKGWKHLVGWVMVVYSIFPIVYVISGSFANADQFTSTLSPRSPLTTTSIFSMTRIGHLPAGL